MSNAARRLGTNGVDVQQAVLENRRRHVHAVGENKVSDKSARGYAAMQERPFGHSLRFRRTLSDHGQLVVFDHDVQLVRRKSGDRQSDAHRAVAGVFDVVGRIAFPGGFAGALDQGAGMLEAEQERTVVDRRTVDVGSSTKRPRRAVPREATVKRDLEMATRGSGFKDGVFRYFGDSAFNSFTEVDVSNPFVELNALSPKYRNTSALQWKRPLPLREWPLWWS